MKLKYKKCLEVIKETTGIKPTHAEISKIIKVSANALSNRLSNDGYLKDDEASKIETYYNVNFLKNTNCISLTYYSNYLELKKSLSDNKIEIPLDCFDGFSQFKKYFALSAIGDTMSPYIKDNDMLIIEYYSGEQIRDNRVYIFNYNNEIFIKRLVKNIDQIVVKSDNEIYPIRFIDAINSEKLNIIGQIVGLIRNAG